MNRNGRLFFLGVLGLGVLLVLALKHHVFTRFGASVPEAPPRPLTLDEEREIAQGVDAMCDRPREPEPEPLEKRGFFKSIHTHGLLRGGGQRRNGVVGVFCPDYSRLESLDYARECYLYRREAFRDLLPVVFAEKIGGTLKNPEVERRIHAVIDRKPLALKSPDVVGESYGYPHPSRSDLPAPKTLGNVQYFLQALKERVIAGKADAVDLEKFRLVKAWVDEKFASYGAEAREMDALVLTVSTSGDPRLVNAVRAKRWKELYINNSPSIRDAIDQAQFSAEPFRLYDPGESKYPIREDEGGDDFPDFGANWEAQPEDKEGVP